MSRAYIAKARAIDKASAVSDEQSWTAKPPFRLLLGLIAGVVVVVSQSFVGSSGVYLLLAVLAPGIALIVGVCWALRNEAYPLSRLP